MSNFHATAGALINNDFICVADYDGLLISIDICTGKTRLLKPKGVNKVFGNVVNGYFILKGWICWVEQYAQRVVLYNPINNNCRFVNLPAVFAVYDFTCFSNFSVWRDKILLVSKDLNYYYTLDVEKAELYEEFRLRNIIQNKLREYKQNVVCSHSLWGKNKLYFFSTNTRLIIVANMESNSVEIRFIPQAVNGVIVHVLYEEGGVYILDSKNNVWFFGEESEEWRLLYSEFERDLYYGRLVRTDRSIFLLPCLGDKMCKIDCKSGVKIFVSMPNEVKYDERKVELGFAKYYEGFWSLEKVWFANRASGHLMSINLNTDEVDWIEIKDLEYNDVAEWCINNGVSFNEKDGWLSNYFKEKCKKKNMNKNMIGNIIYTYLLES